jgi:hypothetical protein
MPGRVIGIEFTDCSAAAWAPNDDQVFPSDDGVVEFGRENGSEPRNWRATPQCGEARFSEYEFPSTAVADTNGPPSGRGTLEDDGSNPTIYNMKKQPNTPFDVKVYSFDPVASTETAATVDDNTNNDSAYQTYDVAVREYSDWGFVICRRLAGATTFRLVRRWFRGSEPGASFGTWFDWPTTAGAVEPQSIDIDPDPNVAGSGDPIVWVAGNDGAGGPFVQRLDDTVPTWNISNPTGYTYTFVDTIQCVGVGEAIGTAINTSASGFDDGITIFEFLLGESDAVEITEGCTVDGDPYRDWAGTNSDNIDLTGGVKMAVRGERVAALTEAGRILIGTLIRATGGWTVGAAGWSA